MLKFATDAYGNLQYLRILKTQEKPAPRSGRTQSGYGSRIPCGFLAQTEEGGTVSAGLLSGLFKYRHMLRAEKG